MTTNRIDDFCKELPARWQQGTVHVCTSGTFHINKKKWCVIVGMVGSLPQDQLTTSGRQRKIVRAPTVVVNPRVGYKNVSEVLGVVTNTVSHMLRVQDHTHRKRTDHCWHTHSDSDAVKFHKVLFL